MNKVTLVQIDWQDSQNWTGWHLLQDVVQNYKNHGLNKQKTVGYIVMDNKDHITVAQSLSIHPENNEIYRGADFMTIPKGCVIKVTKLKS